jgi:hypothetical protein
MLYALLLIHQSNKQMASLHGATQMTLATGQRQNRFVFFFYFSAPIFLTKTMPFLRSAKRVRRNKGRKMGAER